MKVFTPLYQKVLRWVSYDSADKYLYGLSFVEAVAFPVPPDVMLAPMCAARPHDALYLGSLTTAFSVLGGILGYALGFFILDAIEPWLLASHWANEYLSAKHLFEQWGVMIVIIAGFSPVPYKIFTFTAGALQLAFPLFVVASFIGRGGRFLMIALLFRYLGTIALPKVKKIIEQLGWLTVIAFVVFLLVYYLGAL